MGTWASAVVDIIQTLSLWGMILFLIQIGVVMAASQALGRLFRRFGQPPVIGEMVAGIVLGPSLLGWLAPRLHDALFPAASLTPLGLIGQLGLVFYMFLVGATLDLDHLRDNRRVALTASLTSIALPFVSGAALAVWLRPQLAAPGASTLAFALFFGVCLSITAFPVLARILTDTGMLKTPLGAVAISCAAVDDVSAWLILAAVMGFVRVSGQEHSFATTLVRLAIYIAGMILLRRIVAPMARARREGESHKELPLILLAAVASAVATEWIGIHAVFGAFFAGAVMPKRPALIEYVRATVEPFNAVVLLPLFFVITGLRTQIGLVLDRQSLVYTALIVAIAVAGKWLGTTLAARAMGLAAPEANALGILMNTRGLVELVVLNVGYEAGLLPQRVFAMLVTMTILTTVMTTPLLRWTYLNKLEPTQRRVT
jgi:Kef-type K+ transport system membrane component KefB